MFEIGGRHLGEIAICLFIEHQLFAALRPDAPRVVIDHVRDDEIARAVAARNASELDLEIDEQRFAATPRMRQNFERDARDLTHRGEFLRIRNPAMDDLVRRR